MKKKLSTLILIVTLALMLVVLCACNSATTQGQLQNILKDHSYECFVYDVLNTDDNTTGTYTVTLKSYKRGQDVTNFGDVTLQQVEEGILVRGLLEIGTTVFETGCYYNLIQKSSYMVPAHSYRIQKDNGVVTLKLQGSYEGANYKYDLTLDGNKQSGSVKMSNLYYDNNEFHQTLRSTTTMSTGFSFSFGVPHITTNEQTSATLSAVCSKAEKIKTPYTDGVEAYAEEGINCFVVNISRSTQVAGTSQTLYYSTEDVKINNWPVYHVLVKIVEPFKNNTGEKKEIVYSLRSISIEEPTA